VLADAYVRPAYFPHTPPRLLQPGQRIEGLVARMEALAPDVLCLQEVEPALFRVLTARLGMAGCFAQKANKPDGCAVFVRAPLEIGEVREVRFTDGSGSLALLVNVFDPGSHATLVVANTHLKWDPPGTPLDRQQGLQQISQVLAALGGPSADARIRVVCGDFNAGPESPVCALLRDAGLVEPFADRDAAWTSNANGVAKRIDFVFHSPLWRANPVEPPAIDNGTPLPSETEPSDHLPVVVDFG
jgi:endonuclease/exonuclease/phosphatase family metal-dependent hydrolase